jgi:hypothetical protein
MEPRISHGMDWWIIIADDTTLNSLEFDGIQREGSCSLRPFISRAQMNKPLDLSRSHTIERSSHGISFGHMTTGGSRERIWTYGRNVKCKDKHAL